MKPTPAPRIPKSPPVPRPRPAWTLKGQRPSKKNIKKKPFKKLALKNNKKHYQILEMTARNIRVEIDSDELRNNPFTIPEVLNEYRGELRAGKYRFLVFGKDTGQLYLDHTADLFWDFKKRGGLTSSPFWSQNKFKLGWIDSTESVFNINDENKLLIISNQTRIDPSFFSQRFLNADVGHCFFNPMIKYFKENKDKKSTFYKAGYNKIRNWEQKSGKIKYGLIEKYKDGVPEDKIQEISNLLKVGIDISQPLNDNFIRIRPEGDKKVHKVFKFINTVSNHVDAKSDSVSWNNIFCDDKEITTILSNEEIKMK